MDHAVCFREFEQDYTWDNSHASHSVAELAREILAPAMEGAITASRFAALLRSPGSLRGVMLCVSASTTRKDFVGRPIRTMAFLRAETPEETNLLAAFFAECLRKPDSETLYNAESGIAKAVESLYQTKKHDEFLRFCRSLPSANGGGVKPTGRYAIPRDDADTRCEMAESLSALKGEGGPFLIALTDRLPIDVLDSLGSMFDHATVRIFSKATTVNEPLPGGGPNTRVIAAAIGGAALLALVAAVKPCSRWHGGCKTSCGTSDVVCADDGGVAATNATASSRNSETNTLPVSGRGGEPAGKTRQKDPPTNSAPVKAEAKLSVLTVVQPKSFLADDSKSSSEVHIHQGQ